jgi:hypothetical protein
MRKAEIPHCKVSPSQDVNGDFIVLVPGRPPSSRPFPLISLIFTRSIVAARRPPPVATSPVNRLNFFKVPRNRKIF